jgi:hypothetical protein
MVTRTLLSVTSYINCLLSLDFTHRRHRGGGGVISYFKSTGILVQIWCVRNVPTAGKLLWSLVKIYFVPYMFWSRLPNLIKTGTRQSEVLNRYQTLCNSKSRVIKIKPKRDARTDQFEQLCSLGCIYTVTTPYKNPLDTIPTRDHVQESIIHNWKYSKKHNKSLKKLTYLLTDGAAAAFASCSGRLAAL